MNEVIIPQYMWIYLGIVLSGMAVWLIGLKFGDMVASIWNKIAESTVMSHNQFNENK